MTERLFESEPVWKHPFTPSPWNTDGLEVWTESDLCWGGPICAVIDEYPRGFNAPRQNMFLVAAAPDLYLAAERYVAAVESADTEAQNEALVALGYALDKARLGPEGGEK